MIPRPEIIAILKNSPNSASRFKSVEPSFSSRIIISLKKVEKNRTGRNQRAQNNKGSILKEEEEERETYKLKRKIQILILRKSNYFQKEQKAR